MLRLSKKTDYALIALTYVDVARQQAGERA